MDNKTKLEGFTTRELVEELRRRIAELDEARSLLSGVGQSASSTKNPRISSSKVAYWREWHAYKATHPGATVADWRKSQKQNRKAK